MRGPGKRLKRQPRGDGKYRCSKCGQWFVIERFQVRRQVPSSWCKMCTNGVVTEQRTHERQITSQARKMLYSRAAYASWEEFGRSIGVSRQRAEQIAITALAKLIKYRENFVAQDFF